MLTILLVIVVLMLPGGDASLATQPGMGYYPSGGLGLVLLALVVFMLLGRL